jgi:hypothetical protein
MSMTTPLPPETPSPPSTATPAKQKMTRQSKWQLAISLLLTASAVSYCAPPGVFKPSMDITGIVYDIDTKQPLEGAYVLAVYEESAVSGAGSSNWCVKTKGMYTGKDGSYHFPIEQFDNGSPANIHAIKPDYYFVEYDRPPNVRYGWHLKSTFANRHIYLKKENKAKPEFRHGFHDCERPKSAQDLVAALQFIKIKHAEYIKFDRDAIVINDVAEDIARIEKMLAKPLTKTSK